MRCSLTRLQSIREGTVQYSSTTENLIQTLCNISNATQNCTRTTATLNNDEHNVLVHIILKGMVLPTQTNMLLFMHSRDVPNLYAVILYGKTKGDNWRMFTLLFPVERQFIVTTFTTKSIVKEVCTKFFNSFVRCNSPKNLILLQISYDMQELMAFAVNVEKRAV